LWVQLGAGSWYEASITGGLYYASDDGGSDDLIKAVNDAIAGSPDFTAGTLVWNKQTGTWSLANFTGSTMRIRSSDPVTSATSPGGRAILDHLRIGLNGSGTFASNAIHTPADNLPHHGGFYPNLYMTEDRPKFEARVRQSVPDRGPVQTLSFGYIRKQIIGLRLAEGYPRRTGESEWRQLHNFMERHLKGIPFRFYPDRDNDVASALPFSERVNPLGYHTLVIDAGRTSWEPDFPFSPNMSIADTRIEAYAYVPRS